jgi:2-keto-4-pentenoate hydratase
MEVNQISEKIRNAYTSRVPISPISEVIGIENISLAYEIQNANTEFRLKQGAKITGKKIGLTSKAIQQQLGVDQPDFGILFHDMEVLNGLSHSMKEMIQPRVEAEIAFVLSKDLDRDNLTILDIIDAIDYALPAIEIIDSRIADWKIKITDTIADNASSSHYVIGHTPKTINQFDVVNTKMKMSINGKLVTTGIGSACLGSPLNATLWLAQRMVQLGSPLKAGELVLSGAVGPMFSVKAGDTVLAEFDVLGSVSITFSN